MDSPKLRKLANHFTEAKLISLHALPMAAEINPRDHGGPFVVMQQGYDPDDLLMKPGEYILSRSGAWLETCWAVRLPATDRHQEFIFGTAAEVMELMESLTGKVVVMHPNQAKIEPNGPVDEQLQAILQACGQSADGLQPAISPANPNTP